MAAMRWRNWFASRRLDHVRSPTQKLDPLARLARLLEDAFQVLEGLVRCFALAVEQAAVAGHSSREIAREFSSRSAMRRPSAARSR